jgi:TonB-linked SusC/RagA family outer membrane protein
MNFYIQVGAALNMRLLNDRLFQKRLIMRLNLIFFVVLAFLTQVSANGFSQITIKGTNISVKQVIKKIEQQSGYVFLMYDDTDLLKAKVSLDLHNANIEDALSAGFKGTGITYSIVEKNVLLKKGKRSFIDRLQSIFSIKRDLDFKVIGDDGQTLIGAILKISSSNIIYRSDNKGFFHLKDIDDNTILEISFIGYETTSFRAGHINGAVSLKKITTKLEEVVINKGYYTTTQKLNTGSSVQITSKELERQPLTNPISALQGLVPGMYIKQSSGVSGALNTVQIRGRSSINSGTAPLYILDGVPFSGVAVDRQIGAGAQLIGGQANGSTDPMNVINPADIESITVLKDADATAIYGSRGANGVVLITTKKAKPGASSFNVNVQRSFGEVVNQMDLLPLNEYLALRRKAFENDARTPTAAIAPDLMTWDQNTSTNFQDLLIGNTSKSTDVISSLSIGTIRSSILLGGTFHDEQSILYGGKGFKRGTVNMSASTTSTDDRLKLGIGASLSFGKNNMPGGDFTSSLYTIPQNYPLYNASGGINWVTNFNSPIATSRQVFQNDSKNINLNANLSYKILDELTFRTTFGYNKIEQTQSFQGGASTLSPLNGPTVSAGLYATSNTQALVVEPQFDYTRKFGDHNINLSTGGTWQGTGYEMPYLITANTFASEALLGSFTNAASFTSVRALNSDYKYISFFGRANYNFNEKYVINATLRRDGSSRFGPDKKFGTFASVGAAWIFSDEAFMQQFNWLNFGKVRASYGITGNDQIDNYGYSDTYTSTSSSYGGNPGFYPTRIANPTFSWESNRKFEIAMELGFLNDRIHFTPAFFRNRSDNMVVRTTPLPAQTGFTSYTTNLDALVQNQGFEVDLRVTPIQTKQVRWDMSINLTQSRNKLMSLPSSLTTLYANTYQVGQPLSTITGYHFLGFENGVAQFEDRNGDGTITSGLTGDYYVIGQREPVYYGGFTSALAYKGFRLDVLFNFSKQKANTPIGYPGAFGSQLASLSSSPFIPSSTTTTASYASYSRYTSSDGIIVDASYIRLRNLSLNYSLPVNWTKTVKITQAQIFLRGQNLWTITKYKGLDPETQTGVLPPLKMFTVGLSCSF